MHNALTWWFGSSLHLDDGDKLGPEWSQFLDRQIDLLSSSSDPIVQVCLKYLLTYKRTIGDVWFKRTICTWTSVRKVRGTPKRETSYKQWFVLDNLGAAHNISSNQLENEDVGSFGGIFFSGVASHASTCPVGVDSDGLIHLSATDEIPAPLAWGR